LTLVGSPRFIPTAYASSEYDWPRAAVGGLWPGLRPRRRAGAAPSQTQQVVRFGDPEGRATSDPPPRPAPFLRDGS
jgi:hypothetical protein